MAGEGKSASELFEELQASVRAATEGDRSESALVERALDAALTDDLEERAWALVTLGGVLSVLGHFDQALDALRTAIRTTRSNESRVAALITAAAIRCDQGEFEDAARIGVVIENNTGDAHLLRLLGQVFLRTADLAGSEALQAQGRRCLERAALEEAFANA